MWRAVLRHAKSWLGRKPRSVPFLIALKMTRLRSAVRLGGPGSDLAAAELRGITTTIMSFSRSPR